MTLSANPWYTCYSKDGHRRNPVPVLRERHNKEDTRALDQAVRQRDLGRYPSCAGTDRWDEMTMTGDTPHFSGGNLYCFSCSSRDNLYFLQAQSRTGQVTVTWGRNTCFTHSYIHPKDWHKFEEARQWMVVAVWEEGDECSWWEKRVRVDKSGTHILVPTLFPVTLKKPVWKKSSSLTERWLTVKPDHLSNLVCSGASTGLAIYLTHHHHTLLFSTIHSHPAHTWFLHSLPLFTLPLVSRQFLVTVTQGLLNQPLLSSPDKCAQNKNTSAHFLIHLSFASLPPFNSISLYFPLKNILTAHALKISQFKLIDNHAESFCMSHSFLDASTISYLFTDEKIETPGLITYEFTRQMNVKEKRSMIAFAALTNDTFSHKDTFCQTVVKVQSKLDILFFRIWSNGQNYRVGLHSKKYVRDGHWHS